MNQILFLNCQLLHRDYYSITRYAIREDTSDQNTVSYAFVIEPLLQALFVISVFSDVLTTSNIPYSCSLSFDLWLDNFGIMNLGTNTV